MARLTSDSRAEANQTLEDSDDRDTRRGNARLRELCAPAPLMTATSPVELRCMTRWPTMIEVPSRACSDCQGSGYVPAQADDRDRLVVECPTCSGTGLREQAA
jgi:hypothetical protein